MPAPVMTAANHITFRHVCGVFSTLGIPFTEVLSPKLTKVDFMLVVLPDMPDMGKTMKKGERYAKPV